MGRITPSANPPYGLTTCSLVRVRTLAGLIGRREDMLIDDAGLANEAGPFQLCFRNKSYDFAHRRLRIFERICEHCEANIVPSLTDSPSVKMRPLARASTAACGAPTDGERRTGARGDGVRPNQKCRKQPHAK